MERQPQHFTFPVMSAYFNQFTTRKHHALTSIFLILELLLHHLVSFSGMLLLVGFVGFPCFKGIGLSMILRI
jgi:hypothetical protein